jgi:hypothetical protein
MAALGKSPVGCSRQFGVAYKETVNIRGVQIPSLHHLRLEQASLETHTKLCRPIAQPRSPASALHTRRFVP